MKRITHPKFFLIFLVVSAAAMSVSGQQTNLCSNEPTYDYRTKLKGGYRIVFKTDTDSMYLYLVKANRRIAELTGGFSCGLLHKNLGYVAADFESYFVLVHSFGSGNPHEVELIRKSDGKNVLEAANDACWIDANQMRSVFLFSYGCVPKANDRIVLLNLKNMKKRYLYFPKSMFSDPEVLGRIEIASISRSNITLRFRDFNGTASTTRSYKY